MIRHGQSLENISQATTPNCGLSPLGFIQASLIADFFLDIPLDKLFSSPFRRAVQTALPLAESKKLPIVLIPEMSEIFTEFHGAPLKEHYPWEISSHIVTEFPTSVFRDLHVSNPQWWPKEWPETYAHVLKRTASFYDNELAPLLSTKEHVSVFGHGASTDALKLKICPEAKYPVLVDTNAVIYEFELDKAGVCLHYKVHTDFLGGHMSPKCTAYGDMAEPLA